MKKSKPSPKAKKASKPKSAPKKRAASAKPPKAAPAGKPAAKSKRETPAQLRRKLMNRKATKPTAFSLEEVRAIAKKNSESRTVPAPGKAKGKTAKAPAKLEKLDHKPNHVKAASITDILGFNPNARNPEPKPEKKIPTKYRRYHKLLLELREHVLSGLNLHAEETLKRSSKEDSGDLSSYGQHMADAGTDTFDRDFALSLVSSEQEALSEIEAAIQRIHKGTYGTCEVTGKPIAKERLLAVPFARYSVEHQAEMEKTSRRSVQRGGVFTDGVGEDAAKFMEDDSDD